MEGVRARNARKQLLHRVTGDCKATIRTHNRPESACRFPTKNWHDVPDANCNANKRCRHAHPAAEHTNRLSNAGRFAGGHRSYIRLEQPHIMRTGRVTQRTSATHAQRSATSLRGGEHLSSTSRRFWSGVPRTSATQERTALSAPAEIFYRLKKP